MTINYCLPIIKSHKDEVLEILRARQARYAYFEVWLDYIKDLDDAFIETLEKEAGAKLIVLFRRQKLEPIRMNMADRQHIMSLLGGSQVLVDLDISQQREEPDYIKQQKLAIRTIVSYHNYEMTPEDTKLKELLEAMAASQPAIRKISTYCNSRQDALRLLGLLLDVRAKDQPCIVLGMGEYGAITRVFGTLWGNEMIFAPESADEQSAPGQLSRQQLEDIFAALSR